MQPMKIGNCSDLNVHRLWGQFSEEVLHREGWEDSETFSLILSFLNNSDFIAWELWCLYLKPGLCIYSVWNFPKSSFVLHKYLRVPEAHLSFISKQHLNTSLCTSHFMLNQNWKNRLSGSLVFTCRIPANSNREYYQDWEKLKLGGALTDWRHSRAGTYSQPWVRIGTKRFRRSN